MKSLQEIQLEDAVKQKGHLYQQYLKDHPDTDEKPWTGEEKEFYAKLEKDAEDSIAALEAYRKNKTARADRDKKRDEFNAYLREPASTPKIHSGRRSEVDDEEFRQLQKEAFYAVARAGFINQERVVEQFAKENGITGIPLIAIWKEGEKTRSREMNALVVADDSLGGAMVPPQAYAELVKNLAAPAKLEAKCTTIPVSGPYLPFPRLLPATSPNTSIRSTDYAGGIKAEAPVTVLSNHTVQNQPKTGKGRIQVHRYQPDPIFMSRELVDDAPAFQAVLDKVILETLLLDRENYIINGTGEPMIGVLNGAGDYAPGNVNSGASGELAWGDATGVTGILGMLGNLPEQYAERPDTAIVCRRATFFACYGVQDNAGNFVLTTNMPVMQLMGVPVITSAFVPAIGVGNIAMIIGAWSFFWIADRMELQIGRLQEVAWPDMYIQPVARFGGQAVVGDAFRTLTLS